jgi:Outer membrane protein beta-barrel domain
MKKSIRNTSITCVLGLLFAVPSFAQRVKQLNLPAYDREKLHFGFSLAVNKANFLLYPAEDAAKPDSVLGVEAIPDWGFNIGIVSDLRLHEYVTLRFLPDLSFKQGVIQYRIHPPASLKADSSYLVAKKIGSTLLDFPLNLKIRSERLNNMSVYLLAGGKFSIDLESQAKTKNPDIVKLNNKDWSLEAGVGLDFYLTYFKLSTEIKFSTGLKNRLFHEPIPTTYSSPLEKILTNTWLFSLNFEG